MTGLAGSSPNAAAICARSRSSACSRTQHTAALISVARVRRLRGEYDQQPQEVRVALERADDGRHRAALSQILGRGPSARTEPAGFVAGAGAAQR